MQLRRPAGRVDAQLVAQGAAVGLVAGEGVGLAARPVQGEHVGQPELLAPRVGVDQRREIVRHPGVLAEGKAGVGQRLVGREPALVELADRAAGERQVGDLAVGRTPPQRQRPLEQLDRVPRGGAARGLVDEGAEAPCVDRLGGHRQRVAGRRRHDQGAGAGLGTVERPPKLGDLRGEEAGRVRAVGRLAPEIVDQAIGADRLAPVDQQVGQERAAPWHPGWGPRDPRPSTPRSARARRSASGHGTRHRRSSRAGYGAERVGHSTKPDRPRFGA